MFVPGAFDKRYAVCHRYLFWLTIWDSLIIIYPDFKAHTVWLALGRVVNRPGQEAQSWSWWEEAGTLRDKIWIGHSMVVSGHLGSIIVGSFLVPPTVVLAKMSIWMRWLLMTLSPVSSWGLQRNQSSLLIRCWPSSFKSVQLKKIYTPCDFHPFFGYSWTMALQSVRKGTWSLFTDPQVTMEGETRWWARRPQVLSARRSKSL